ncbi:hypothetical protein RintRC_5867 [Richelia intracellularis]|nr:hypothetical protein RintRC_5867 [Richelia intracellularis]
MVNSAQKLTKEQESQILPYLQVYLSNSSLHDFHILFRYKR